MEKKKKKLSSDMSRNHLIDLSEILSPEFPVVPPRPREQEYQERRPRRAPKDDQPSRHWIMKQPMPKLHADKKLHYAYGYREPAEGPNLLHRFAVLQVGVVLSDRRNRNQPPKDQSVRDQWIPRRDPEAGLKEKCVELHHHENDAEEQHLDEPQRPHEWLPLILVPLRRCELAQRSFHLTHDAALSAQSNPFICFTVEVADRVHSRPNTKPIADQDVQDNTIPPTLIKVWQHMSERKLH